MAPSVAAKPRIMKIVNVAVMTIFYAWVWGMSVRDQALKSTEVQGNYPGKKNRFVEVSRLSIGLPKFRVGFFHRTRHGDGGMEPMSWPFLPCFYIFIMEKANMADRLLISQGLLK